MPTVVDKGVQKTTKIEESNQLELINFLKFSAKLGSKIVQLK